MKIVTWKQSLSISDTWGDSPLTPEHSKFFLDTYIWDLQNKNRDATVSVDFIDGAGTEQLYVEWMDDAGNVHIFTDVAPLLQIAQLRTEAHLLAYVALDDEIHQDSAAYDGLD